MWELWLAVTKYSQSYKIMAMADGCFEVCACSEDSEVGHWMQSGVRSDRGHNSKYRPIGKSGAHGGTAGKRAIVKLTKVQLIFSLQTCSSVWQWAFPLLYIGHYDPLTLIGRRSRGLLLILKLILRMWTGLKLSSWLETENSTVFYATVHLNDIPTPSY
jgi:hypothetical protein